VGTLQDVDSQGIAPSDEDRTVDLLDEDDVLLPEQTRDDTDRGWGEHIDSNDERLLAERPPHWQ
jgi:hypothetical protein